MGKELFPANTIKDLSVFLNSNLPFDKHITRRASSCMHCPSEVKSTIRIFNKHTLLTIINSNKLFYCSNVWPSTFKRNIMKLQSIQNLTCCIVQGPLKYNHIRPLLKELNCLPVASKLYLPNTIMTFKSHTFEIFLLQPIRKLYFRIVRVMHVSQASRSYLKKIGYLLNQSCTKDSPYLSITWQQQPKKCGCFFLDVKQYLYCPIFHNNTNQSSSHMQSLTDRSEVTENKLQ